VSDRYGRSRKGRKRSVPLSWLPIDKIYAAHSKGEKQQTMLQVGER
jgi:hypothetical protein